MDYLTTSQLQYITEWNYRRVLIFCHKYGQEIMGQWVVETGTLKNEIEDRFSELLEMKSRLINADSIPIRGNIQVHRQLSERNQIIVNLRFKECWSLQKIGDEFGLTRERIRQIVGNSGYLVSKKLREEIKGASPNESNPELAKKLGVSLQVVSVHREGWHVVNGDSGLARGNGWELWIAKELEKRGHVIELQSLGTYFDILIDDSIKIDVKSSNPRTPKSLDGRMKSPQYHFQLKKQPDRNAVDFYICITADTEDVFVIPYDKLPMPKTSLFFCWPTLRPEIGKYQKYYNRWDLLIS